MSHPDVAQLRRRLDHLTRAAGAIRTHAHDLWVLGWEPGGGDHQPVNGGSPDRTPRAGDPRARRLFDRIVTEAARAEAELVGLERTMRALFFAGSSNPEPSRGSMISRLEFDGQLARQRRRPDTPARLVDQPTHPGARR